MSGRHDSGDHHHRRSRRDNGHEDRWERDDMRDYLDSLHEHLYERVYPRRSDFGIGRRERREPRTGSGFSDGVRDSPGQHLPPTNMSPGRRHGSHPHAAVDTIRNHHRRRSPESLRGHGSTGWRYSSDDLAVQDFPEDVDRRFEEQHRKYHERIRDHGSIYERSPAGRHRSVSHDLPSHRHHHRSGPRPYPRDGRSMAGERSIHGHLPPRRRDRSDSSGDEGWLRAEMPLRGNLGARGGSSPEPIGIDDNDDDLDDVIRRIEALDPAPDVDPPSLSRAILANLRKIQISRSMLASDGKANCSICMEDVSVGEEVTELPCKHWFPSRCISTWLSSNDTCPHCRAVVTSNEGPSSQDRTRPPMSLGEGDWSQYDWRGGEIPPPLPNEEAEFWQLYEQSMAYEGRPLSSW